MKLPINLKPTNDFFLRQNLATRQRNYLDRKRRDDKEIIFSFLFNSGDVLYKYKNKVLWFRYEENGITYRKTS